MEQVELLSEKCIPAIAEIATNVTCIHFEPFGYQIAQPVNDVDTAHKKLFHDKGWNKNLLIRLLEAHYAKKIDLSFLGKNIVGSNDQGLNPSSIAIWNSLNNEH